MLPCWVSVPRSSMIHVTLLLTFKRSELYPNSYNFLCAVTLLIYTQSADIINPAAARIVASAYTKPHSQLLQSVAEGL